MTKKRFRKVLGLIEDSDGSLLDLTGIEEMMNTLNDKNEQLKQQIHQLQHWNKCLAEKRHHELSYRPYTFSKSENELKELLEPKLFNCNDR